MDVDHTHALGSSSGSHDNPVAAAAPPPPPPATAQTSSTAATSTAATSSEAAPASPGRSHAPGGAASAALPVTASSSAQPPAMQPQVGSRPARQQGAVQELVGPHAHPSEQQRQDMEGGQLQQQQQQQQEQQQQPEVLGSGRAQEEDWEEDDMEEEGEEEAFQQQPSEGEEDGPEEQQEEEEEEALGLMEDGWDPDLEAGLLGWAVVRPGTGGGVGGLADLHTALASLVAATQQEEEEQEEGGGGGGGAEEAGMEEGGAAVEGPLQPFDTQVVLAHSYLGEMSEVQGGGAGYLPEGTELRLPLLTLPGVVLFPGSWLPLLLSTVEELLLVRAALTAPSPAFKLVAVAPDPSHLVQPGLPLVGVSAELRQLRWTDAGCLAALGVGRQRLELDTGEPGRSLCVRARVLPEGPRGRLPRWLGEGAGWVVPWAAAAVDPARLAAAVQAALQAVLPSASGYTGDPLALSYWAASNLPLGPSTRQQLLAAPHAAARLRLLLLVLAELGALCCRRCGSGLAAAGDTLKLSPEGIGGTFVNSAGYVHEMVTFTRVTRVTLEGRPDTAHSWFPGYAWTIAYCACCHAHLGWRFTAVTPGLVPRTFYGLTRAALVSRADWGRRSSNGDGSGGGGGSRGGLLQELEGSVIVRRGSEGEEGQGGGAPSEGAEGGEEGRLARMGRWLRGVLPDGGG